MTIIIGVIIRRRSSTFFTSSSSLIFVRFFIFFRLLCIFLSLLWLCFRLIFTLSLLFSLWFFFSFLLSFCFSFSFWLRLRSLASRLTRRLGIFVNFYKLICSSLIYMFEFNSKFYLLFGGIINFIMDVKQKKSWMNIYRLVQKF